MTYVADWDAKGRSNDEEEPARSKWVDKVNGKVINLSNYLFLGMSGWGGYGSSKWDAYGDDAELVDGNIVKITNTSYSGVEAVSLLKGDTIKIRYKVSGYKSGCELFLYTNTRNAAGDIIPSMIREITEDGIYEDTLTWDSVNAANDDVISRVFLVTRTQTPIEGMDITIEQLPLYPGALVGDGVDDTGTADAALGKVGTVLMHWKNEGLPPKSYIYNTGGDDSGRLYAWNASESSTDIQAGIPSTPIEDSEPIMVFRRSGLVSEYPLILPYNNNCPIYRLIFIEEQLNDSQVAFLKWKVSKEYNDWCKANGYEYAVEEMLNN